MLDRNGIPIDRQEARAHIVPGSGFFLDLGARLLSPDKVKELQRHVSAM